MLEITELDKDVAGKVVLRGVSLVAAAGEVHWLHGPNGGGKSTLLRCVAGIWAPDGGDVRVLGKSVVRDGLARRAVGYVPETFAPFPEVTARQAIRLISSLRGGGLDPAHDDPRLRIDEFSHQLVSSLSAGQLRRVALRAGLVGNPWLLVVDEPTNGLDADGVDALVELLARRAAAGQAALVVTHDEAFGARLNAVRHRLESGTLAPVPG